MRIAAASVRTGCAMTGWFGVTREAAFFAQHSKRAHGAAGCKPFIKKTAKPFF
jgi:hypothetical protein